MTGHRARTRTLVTAALAAGLAGCGGGERQDANERAGTFTVDVTRAAFPETQRLSRAATMQIAVKNAGTEAMPNVAVTVDSFSRRSEQSGLADPEQPIWIVDEEPRGGTTAYTNTWALPGLAPGQTKTFRWKVTPIESGSFRVKWTVAAGLDGKAKARDAEGESPVTGTFPVRVSQRPSSARVNPATGEVERSEE